MSFSVEYFPAKEDVFKKSDEECKEIADIFINTGGLFIDPEFPHNKKSLGKYKDPETKSIDPSTLKDPWLPPYKLEENSEYRLFCSNKWVVWDNPWPFYVEQGNCGNCWLLAVVMTMAKREELLEQVLPRRDYTMESGVVQVRLCIEGKWQVIKTDFHLPTAAGKEHFAPLFKKQAWVAFIEKGYAKYKGSYGKLHGGELLEAFDTLTGAFTRKYHLNMLMDKDKLWEQIIKDYSAGYLMTAGTPKIKDAKELKIYEDNGLCQHHGYAMLDFKEFNGHRLIQIGNTNMRRWNGRWSMMPNFPPETHDRLTILEQVFSDLKLFWMSLEDFVRFFEMVAVCEYREGWEEVRFKQRIRRRSGRETQILRLHVKQRCELAMDVTNVEMPHCSYNLFINIHRCMPENTCGELISFSHEYFKRVSTGQVRLDPGVYLIVAVDMDRTTNKEWHWVIRSPTMDRFSFDFINCPFSTLIHSIQQVIAKNAVVEVQEQDNIVVYTWETEKSLFIMMDNKRKRDYIRVSGILNSLDKREIDTNGAFRFSVPVPPMSRQIVGFISHLEGGKFYLNAHAKYRIRWEIWKWLDWLDSAFAQPEIFSIDAADEMWREAVEVSA
ncbi:unnamed protein product [Caenorhabditis brenneri]